MICSHSRHFLTIRLKAVTFGTVTHLRVIPYILIIFVTVVTIQTVNPQDIRVKRMRKYISRHFTINKDIMFQLLNVILCEYCTNYDERSNTGYNLLNTVLFYYASAPSSSFGFKCSGTIACLIRIGFKKLHLIPILYTSSRSLIASQQLWHAATTSFAPVARI